MNLRLTYVAAAAVALFSGGIPAFATPVPVSWTINSSKSVFTLKIPDQDFRNNGFGFLIHVRNQNSGTAWNKGNSASIAGTVQTTWDPNPANPNNPAIAFTGSGNNIVGVNSGTYRPNATSYSGGTINPDGTANGGNFSNSSAQPAVFAAQVQDFGTAFPFTASYIGFYNTFFDVSSGNIGVNGAPAREALEAVRSMAC